MVYKKIMQDNIKKGICICCNKQFAKISIHHVDGNHENNNPLNLVPLCSCCHTFVHKGFQKRKNLDEDTIDKIQFVRRELIQKTYKKDTIDFLKYEKAVVKNKPLSKQKCYSCGATKHIKVIAPKFVLKFDKRNNKSIGFPFCSKCAKDY